MQDDTYAAIAVLKSKQETQDREIAELKKENKELRDRQDEFDKLDRNRMRTAIIMLGGGVISLISYIYTGGQKP